MAVSVPDLFAHFLHACFSPFDCYASLPLLHPPVFVVNYEAEGAALSLPFDLSVFFVSLESAASSFVGQNKMLPAAT